MLQPHGVGTLWYLVKGLVFILGSTIFFLIKNHIFRSTNFPFFFIKIEKKIEIHQSNFLNIILIQNVMLIPMVNSVFNFNFICYIINSIFFSKLNLNTNCHVNYKELRKKKRKVLFSTSKYNKNRECIYVPRVTTNPHFYGWYWVIFFRSSFKFFVKKLYNSLIIIIITFGRKKIKIKV